MEGGDNRQAADIQVLSKDPEKKDDDKPKANGNGKLKEEKAEPEIVSSSLLATIVTALLVSWLGCELMSCSPRRIYS